jgi:hypothetical protein
MGPPLTRITHPNTTDTLIEVYDVPEGAWEVSRYWSGWRDITPAAPTGWTSVSDVRVARTNDIVTVMFSGVADSSGLGSLVTLPAGFTGLTGAPHSVGNAINYATGEPCGAVYIDSASLMVYRGAGTTMNGSVMFLTDDALPGPAPS